jgi:hypothetical protein
MKGIYLLQLDDEPPLEETTETEDPLILLNAITGLTGADTMQLAVRVGDQLLGALVDFGSTHSFISVAAASQLHLDPLPLSGLRVKVANSDRVPPSASVARLRSTSTQRSSSSTSSSFPWAAMTWCSACTSSTR